MFCLVRYLETIFNCINFRFDVLGKRRENVARLTRGNISVVSTFFAKCCFNVDQSTSYHMVLQTFN